MKQKQLRDKRFLNEVENIVPWNDICDELQKQYRDDRGGRPAHELIAMLKIHFLQQWYNLSNPAI